MKEERGQAAMEFLMTYGWAILVVLIAIGALAYFGVLSPGRFLPQSCTLAPGFACSDFKINNAASTADDLTIIVRNGLGSTANSVTFTAREQGQTTDCAPNVANPTSISDGSEATFNWNCPGVSDSTAEGSRFKATLTLGYTLQGQTLSHTVTGDMTSRVE